MTSKLHALRNYLKHAHEDRMFRWALLAAAVLAVLAAGHIAAQARPVFVVLDSRTCHPYIKGWAMCPLPSPSADARR